MIRKNKNVVICGLSVAAILAFYRMEANATGLSSILPAAGLGLELAEGKSVKEVREDVISKVQLDNSEDGSSVSENSASENDASQGTESDTQNAMPVFNDSLITVDKEIVEPIVIEEEDSQEEDFTTLVIAQVNDYVNVRDLPSEEDGKIVGKLYDNSVGHFMEEQNGWYKIKSGNCIGFVKAEYCVTGEAAVELAKEVGVRIATVTTTTLKVREEPSLDACVLGLVPIEDELVVVEELDDWVKVDIEEGFGYVSLDYVTLSTEFVEAESKEEEEARLEKERKAREAARAAAAAATAQQSTSSSGYVASAPVSVDGSGMGASVVNYALQFVGNPYVYGGTSLTNGADCSGFVMSVYANFGVALPHSSAADRNVGYDVGGLDNAQPGDLVCYSGHVALYIGNGQIVHASTSKTGIIVSNANYRTPLCVRRIF